MATSESTSSQRPRSTSGGEEPELADLVRLTLVRGIGPRLLAALLERFGSPGSVLSASAAELEAVAGVGRKLSRQIVDQAARVDVRAQLDLCRSRGIELLTRTAPNYPRMLSEIPDPPGILYCRGALRSSDGLAVAVVGARHASRYGAAQAERLAAALARAGMTVVSGLARGIDAAAHRGALAAGGRTIAVLASGLANIYPAEHAELAEQVAASGALLSEAPPQAAPQSGLFPQRNRLISGLSLGVVVVEASARSGALITARHAAEQGREVFAVPGRVDSRNARGCHRLIRDGARLVETVDDVLEELGPLVAPVARDDGRQVRAPAELMLNRLEQRVLEAIGSEGCSIDELVRASGLNVSGVLSTISVLEMRRLVRRRAGNRVARIG